MWIGASLLRKEDARHLLGHGMFIADIRMPGVQDVAFVRSQMAHATVRQVTKPGRPGGSNVFTLADPRRAQHPRSRARSSPRTATAPTRRWPTTGVRYAGQPIAACLARRRAPRPKTSPMIRSTSSSTSCPAVVDCVEAMKPRQPRLFDAWPDNAYITSTVSEGDAVSSPARRSGCAASSA